MSIKVPNHCSYRDIPEADQRPIREHFWFRAQSALLDAEDYAFKTEHGKGAGRSLEDRIRLAATNLERYFHRSAAARRLDCTGFRKMDDRAERVRLWLQEQLPPVT